MALSDVCGYKAEVRAQLSGTGTSQHLLNRTNHFTFGSKIQELALPVGLDVSETMTIFSPIWHNRFVIVKFSIS